MVLDKLSPVRPIRLLGGLALRPVCAGPADSRTTRLYDRRHKTATHNIVGRISIRL